MKKHAKRFEVAVLEWSATSSFVDGVIVYDKSTLEWTEVAGMYADEAAEEYVRDGDECEYDCLRTDVTVYVRESGQPTKTFSVGAETDITYSASEHEERQDEV